MSLGTCTGHWGGEFLQQWFLGVQKWCQMTLEALVDNWLACGGVHCVGPLGKLSLDTMEACLGQGLMMGGSCRGVVAAPVAVRGVGVPEKSSCLRRMTPKVTVGVIQHNGQLIHV